MNRTTRTLAATATGALALGLGIGVAGFASADPTTSPSPSASPSASAPADPAAGAGRGHRGGPRGEQGDALAPELAQKLGVDVADVRSALQDYRQANRPTTRPDPGTRPERRAADDAALAKALSGALDVDQAKVTTALTEIRADRQADRSKAVANRLAKAVKAGTLTQAEADAVQKAADAGIVHVGPR